MILCPSVFLRRSLCVRRLLRRCVNPHNVGALPLAPALQHAVARLLGGGAHVYCTVGTAQYGSVISLSY